LFKRHKKEADQNSLMVIFKNKEVFLAFTKIQKNDGSPKEMENGCSDMACYLSPYHPDICPAWQTPHLNRTAALAHIDHYTDCRANDGICFNTVVAESVA
jgi:hypothetical protein